MNIFKIERDTQKAIFALKDYIEENLSKELNLMRVKLYH